MNNVIYITGTDTAVGKTILTGLLLRQLREQGGAALAMKPFSTGDRGDARFLNSLQDRAVPLDWVNPFFFREPLAPLVAASRKKVRVKKESAIEAIGRMARRCETLLIEGAGGLLTPLGEGFTLLDLMVEIPGSVVVAARNRLGVLNHVALTLAKLNDAVIQRTIVVLMGIRQSSLATQTNPDVLRYLIGSQSVECIPFLGSRLKRRMEFLAAHKKSKIVLARILVGL